jgi:hypothetical protein
MRRIGLASGMRTAKLEGRHIGRRPLDMIVLQSFATANTAKASRKSAKTFGLEGLPSAGS